MSRTYEGDHEDYDVQFFVEIVLTYSTLSDRNWVYKL